MTREFKEAYKKTVANEGYLSNHKDDKGGMTWKGIARNIHPNWAGWKEIDKILGNSGKTVDIKLNRYIEEMVQDFYWLKFWRPIRAQEIVRPVVRNKFFDTAVLHGIKGATQIYQRSLQMEADGKITDEFIKRLNSLVE